MAKKPSWDDIPSLGLTLDDGVSNTSEHRASVRLLSRDLQDLLMMPRGPLPVQIRFKDRTTTGTLTDVSQDGMGVCLLESHGLQRGMTVALASKLGARPLVVRAVVRWAKPDKIGMQFINPKKEDYEFLAELYAAKVLGGGF